MQHLSEKTQFRGFLFPEGSAEALVRSGGKIKYVLIAYFLGNIYAKHCRNRTMYVKIISSCKGGTFFETRCSISATTSKFIFQFFAYNCTMTFCTFIFKPHLKPVCTVVST